MVSVPAFLLRRLYVKGSLASTQDGFSFRLRNTLGSGYAHSLRPLSVDGEEVPIGSCYFLEDGERVGFSDVTKDRTFALAMNADIEIACEGARLAAGTHKIGMGFDVPGMGTLSFDFTDEVP